MASTVACPKCGSSNPADSQYCDQCSAPLHMSRPESPGAATLPGHAAGPPGVSTSPSGQSPRGPSDTLPMGNIAGPPASAPIPGPMPAPGYTPPGYAPPPGGYTPPPGYNPAPGYTPPPAQPTGPMAYTPPGGPTSPLPPGAPTVQPAGAPPLRRGGSPVLLIGAALVAVAIFAGIGFSALLNSNNTPPTATPASGQTNATVTALAAQAFQLAQTLTAVSQAPSPTQVAQVATNTPKAEPATPTTVATFVIPTSQPTPAPTVIGLEPILKDGAPDVGAEVGRFFSQFYEARTLVPGGDFDIATLTNLTAPPYRDYTLGLLRTSVADAQAGVLLEVNYRDISVRVLSQAEPAPTMTAEVEVIRTQEQVRTDKKVAPVTDKLRFRVQRTTLPDGSISWVAYDFFNQATNAWLSDTSTTIPNSQAQIELTDYFNRFYEARTLGSGHDGQEAIQQTGQLTLFAYYDYTIPLLQQQVDDVDAGKVSSVRYTDIRVKLDQWDPLATTHGGIATVHVTRTSHVLRPGQPEDVQTGTYEFRLHRHWDDTGAPFWVAVDFLSPISNKWVSDSAGMVGPVPADGHG